MKGLATVTAVAACASTAFAEVRYAVVDLSVLTGYSSSCGWLVNDAGLVAGLSSSPDRAMVVSQTFGPTDLGVLANSRPGGVNSSGWVIGGFTASDTEGWLWKPGSGTTRLPAFGSYSYMHGAGCNDTGVLVGSGTGLFAAMHAVVWRPDGTKTDLGTLPGHQTSMAMDVNAMGTIVGDSFEQGGRPLAFIVQPGQAMAMLPVPQGYDCSQAAKVNDAGDILGSVAVFGGVSFSPCLWHAGQPVLFSGLHQGTSAMFRDLSDSGWIVGNESNAATSWALVRDPRGRLYSLGDRIDTARSDSWIRLCSANGVNNRGWVTGLGLRPVNGQAVERAFLAVPLKLPVEFSPHP